MKEIENSGSAKHELVEVIVDGVPKKVASGSYIVADFKRTVGVDAVKELEQVVDGKLIPLVDSATLIITKAGERFVSHIRRGGSS